MSILTVQRRLYEIARLRTGTSEPLPSGRGKRPVRLPTFRGTSRNRDVLVSFSEQFGGDVVPWEGRPGEFECISEVDSLPIALIPGQHLSMWLELWGKRGKAAKAPIECLRRCDGQTETLRDVPCLCDPDARECKPRVRLPLLLPDVTGIGCWLYQSSSWYAAAELAGTADMLDKFTLAGMPYPARLRIDQRRGVKDGQPVIFPVPVLDIATTLGEALATLGSEGHAASPRTLALSPGHTPSPPQGHTPIETNSASMGVVSLSDGLDAAARLVKPAATSARSAAPIGPPSVSPVGHEHNAPTSTSPGPGGTIAVAPIPVAPGQGVHFPAATAAATAVGSPDLPVPTGEPSPTVAAADTAPGENDSPQSEQDESLFDDLPGQLPEPHIIGRPTSDQLYALNALVGQLRRDELITTEMVWKSVAVDRDIPWLAIAHDLGGFDDEGVLHWSPLRDDISFAEASDLIDRLGKYADAHKEDK